MKPNDTTSAAKAWTIPAPEDDLKVADFKGNAAEFDEWRELRRKVAHAATVNEWTKAEVARKIDMPAGTFGNWFAGTYNGNWSNQNGTVERWLIALEEAAAIRSVAPKQPGFVRTKSADKFLTAMSVAQSLGKFTMISSAPGTGKTMAAHYYASTAPLVTLATMCPMTRTTFAMLKEIGRAVGLQGGDASNLVPAISDRLWRTGSGALLVIDEAQHLSDDAINQVRHFSDGARAGVVLMGNEETYGRFSNVWMKTDRYGQLASRVFQRINIARSFREDIAAIIEAWGITEPNQVEFLTGIGAKSGGLRHIGETITLAMMRSGGGDQRDLTLTALRKAWTSRNLEFGQ